MKFDKIILDNRNPAMDTLDQQMKHKRGEDISSTQSTVGPMTSLDKLAFNPLTAMATAGNKGGNIFNVLGAGAAATSKEVKDMGTAGVEKMFDPFFNCFKQSFFNGYGNLFVLYAIGKNLSENGRRGIKNFKDPNFLQAALSVVQDEFNAYIPIMAKIIWTDGLSTNLFSTIASGVRNTMFYTTDKLLKMINKQTYNILIPAMGQLSNMFTPEYISSTLEAASTLGFEVQGDSITFNSEGFKIGAIEHTLKEGTMASRDTCIEKGKGVVKAKFSKTVKEAVSQFGNPALDTLAKQLNLTKTQSPSTTISSQPSTETNSTVTPTTSGFGGLGSAEAGQQKYYDILRQAGAKYGLDNTTLTNMGFGQKKESPYADSLKNIPVEKQPDYIKKREALDKEYFLQQQQSPVSNNDTTDSIDDLLSNIFQ